MNVKRFLAFDLGAESGRALAGTLQDGVLAIEEVHRFPNRPVRVLGTLYWNVLELFGNMLEGMRLYSRKCGSRVSAIGIDTWGVDFGLLARDGALLQNPVHYRDRRTEGILEAVEQRMPAIELFRITGMSPSPIQSLCQLLAMRAAGSPLLEAASTLLMMPDLLGYFLTGNKVCERTNAVNTQFYDLAGGKWSEEILNAYELSPAKLPGLVDAGSIAGELLLDIATETGLTPCPVVAPCTHDTGSAVAAVPGADEEWAFLSSGTWSVVGALTDKVVTSDAAFHGGFCNELTIGSPFLCKNIMGLWLLQQARKSWAEQGRGYSYEELAELAARSPEQGPLIDPADSGFLAPANMVRAIQDYCLLTGQSTPQGPGGTARTILESLALACRHALEKLQELLGRRFRVLNIVGGGSRNALLCQLTANATGLPVLAGPAEATAMGNLLVQALALGAVPDRAGIRDVIQRSERLTQYRPENPSHWQRRYKDYRKLTTFAIG